jgi:DNA-binding PadR family transcriptional regulator
MERRLLLLGLLRGQEMHGYQLNDLIDGLAAAGVQLKKPTAYRLLNKMAEDGWVTCREEHVGNRPPRRVYAITTPGEAEFDRLLRQSLARYSPVDFLGNVGVLFLDAVPAEEALLLLRQRRRIVKGLLEATRTQNVRLQSSLLMLVHQARHLATELDWLDRVLAWLGSPSRDLAPWRQMLRSRPLYDAPPQPRPARRRPRWRPEID